MSDELLVVEHLRCTCAGDGLPLTAIQYEVYRSRVGVLTSGCVILCRVFEAGVTAILLTAVLHTRCTKEKSSRRYFFPQVVPTSTYYSFEHSVTYSLGDNGIQ